MARATYEMQRWHRPMVIVGLALVIVVAAVVITRMSAGYSDGPPLPFMLLWLAVLGWASYWWLFRICYRLELDDRMIRWYAPLRRGELALSDLREIVPFRLGSNVAVLKTVQGDSVLVAIRKGFTDFARAVQEAAPQVDVRLGWPARLVERMPGRSGFEAG